MPTLNPTALEPAIQRIGREIFDRAEAAAPSMLSFEYWQRAGLEWLARDEDLKLRLFRFIEVYPALRDNAAVARHLYEYLHASGNAADRNPLPAALDLAVALARPGAITSGLVAGMVRLGCGLMARQFVCGSTTPEAVDAVRRMRRAGMTFTLDVLGETVIADHVARAHQELYIELVQALSRAAPGWEPARVLDQAPYGPLPRINISIKLSAIVPKFDPVDVAATERIVLERLRPIFRAARTSGAFINVDMEHYAVKDLTLHLFRRVLEEDEFRAWPDVGTVIQAYLTDAHRDMQEMIAWARRRGTPITIRLVKGAYWDYETIQSMLTGRPIPVWTRKWQSDAEYERIARLMLQNVDAVRPAFASHNVRSIAAALATESALGLPPRTLEFQMLTGMGDQLKRALVDLDQRLRVYAPFGDMVPGMAYLIRRLIENTSNESFLRQSFTQHTPVRALLRDPAANGQPGTDRPYRAFIQDPDDDEYPDMPAFENEPEIDLSQAASREAMQSALESVRGQFGRRWPAIVGRDRIETDEWFASHNPSDHSQIVGYTAQCDSSIADRAVVAARTAACDWAATPAFDRAAALRRAADRLRDRIFEFAAWQVYEVGKTWREALADVVECIDYLRFYARETERLAARPRLRDFPGEHNEYVHQPRGVVLVISPFCFPAALLGGMTAAALAAGNAVVVKPAREASVVGCQLAELLIDAGLPPGVLNVVPGPGDTVGRYLTHHDGIDMIAFTGSSAVGAEIIDVARQPMPERHAWKHVVADMGGKNAIVIDDDADLDEAVQATMASAFSYAGQKCTSCSRAIVLDRVYDDYLAKLVEAARGMKPAPADLPGTSLGPLIDAQAVKRVQTYVETGRREARCVLDWPQSSVKGSTGYFIGPVIFADVPPRSVIAQQEIFGPVLAVIRAGSFEEACAIANDSPYALTGGVYSRSPGNIEYARRHFRVGNLYINRRITASRVDRQPFGGFGFSGLGTKTGGPDYLKQFMLPRTLSENTMRHGFAPVAGGAKKEPQHERSTVISH